MGKYIPSTGKPWEGWREKNWRKTVQYNRVQIESLIFSSCHPSPCSPFQTKTVLETKACWYPPLPVLWGSNYISTRRRWLYGASPLDRRQTKEIPQWKSSQILSHPNNSLHRWGNWDPDICKVFSTSQRHSAQGLQSQLAQVLVLVPSVIKV